MALMSAGLGRSRQLLGIRRIAAGLVKSAKSARSRTYDADSLECIVIDVRANVPVFILNSFRLFATLAILALAGSVQSPLAVNAQENPQVNRPVYFEETGQILSGPFLDSWFRFGGPDRTGFPVTAPMRIGDRWVQWFEYARFEVPAETYEGAPVDAIESAPIGSAYARTFGYARAHPAFAPVGGAGEGGRYFEDSRHTVANAFLAAYDLPANNGRYGLPISEEFAINGTTYQFFEHGALSWTEATGVVRVPVGTLDAMIQGTLGSRVEQPENADIFTPDFFALRGQYPGERWIEVNTSAFTLTAWEGDTPVMKTLIVTGASLTPTVEGEFHVYWKIPSQTMTGAGPDGIRYIQADVPSVMYFFQDWAIHGTYWRSSFGYAASHGCVNVPLSEAAWLYEWASIGTRVVVHI
jgi:hypothetical protein